MTATTAPETERLTILEAAMLLDRSPSTIRNLIRVGTLPAVRVLGKILISRGDAERLAVGEPVPVKPRPAPAAVRSAQKPAVPLRPNPAKPSVAAPTHAANRPG